MSVDWKGLEDFVVETSSRDLAAFAKKHAAEPIYCVVFDCDSGNAAYEVSLNTATELADDARWDFGAFKYREASGPHIQFEDEEVWEEFASQLQDAFESEYMAAEEAGQDIPFTKAEGLFLDTMCRAALRVAPTLTITKTPDFRIVVRNQTESTEDALARLEQFQKSSTT